MQIISRTQRVAEPTRGWVERTLGQPGQQRHADQVEAGHRRQPAQHVVGPHHRLDVPQQQVQAAARDIDQITAKITSLRADALGRISFVLDNGQVWRMTESEGVFDFPNRGDTVTIRRGAIGGYRLDWGTNIGVRVARAD